MWGSVKRTMLRVPSLSMLPSALNAVWMGGMIPVFMDEKLMALYDDLTALTTEAVKFFLYGVSEER